MTKRERVINAIQGKDVDGIPSSFSLHFPEHQAVGDAAVEAHLQFFKDTDTDIIKIMNENLLPAPEVGYIRTPEEYYDAVPEITEKTAFITDQIEMTKKILDRADKDAFSLGTLHGVCATGIHPLMHMGEGFTVEESRQIQLDFLRWNEKKMLDAMERITEGMCILAKAYVDAGVDAVYYAALGAERKWFTEEEYERWIKPFDLRIMKAIKDAGGYCFLHMCKYGLNMKRYDKDYAALSDVVNWGVYEAPMSLEEGRKQFEGVTVCGGLKNRTGVLVDGTAEDVKKEVREVINGFGRKGFILGADCTMDTEQDRSLVRAAVEEARNM